MSRNNSEDLLAPHPTAKLDLGCPRLLIQYFCSYLPYWRPFFICN